MTQLLSLLTQDMFNAFFFSYASFLIVLRDQIMEGNRQGREDRSRVTLTPDVIMHVLRLQRRQTLAYIERRHNRADIVSDEEDAEGHLLGLLDGDVSSEEDSPGNSRDCNIS